MIQTFLVTALLIFPAAVLILVGDQVDPVEEAKRISRKNARASDDRTQLRLRLEELGRSGEKNYEDFRIRQYGYGAGAAAIGFAFFTAISASLFLGFVASLFFGTAIYLLIDRQLTQDVKKRRELIEAEFPAIVEMLTLAIAAGETPMSAMLRIAQSADGALPKEFAIVIADVR